MTKHFANIITMSNLVFGFLSLHYTMVDRVNMAAMMIICSVIMDSMDGRIARHFDTVGDIGKNLDSLCDLVSFGIAPALLVYQFTLVDYSYWGMIPCILFCLSGAYRLARFNVACISAYFVGVPITFAGGLVAALSILLPHMSSLTWMIILLLLAILMVSYLKVPKMGNKNKNGEENA
ncbi:MAG: CDP-diacylglycerol--serine O-phosphatidyltransferase [Clostridiales bacterium]